MKNLKTNMKKGFSLVELLVVIAVIGVIAAIAIPAMSGIFGKADSAKEKRNAQNLVSTFNAARAAGNTQTFANAAAAIAAITDTSTGGISGGGTFSTSKFFVSMDAGEVTKARALIQTGIVGSTNDGTLAMVASTTP
jgi:prepilin-type N-terminal cleavage/methylation domain-containing protein